MSVTLATGNHSGISLRAILPNATFLHADDLTVRQCSHDLSQCQRNDLFVALLQADRDSHEDATEAIRKGAKAILCERLLPVSMPQCIVDDTRIAYGKINHALANHPCAKLKTIAVSGTDGKTTTCHLLESILKAAGKSAGLRTSITEQANAVRYKRHGKPILARQLQKMVQAGRELGIMEAHSEELAEHAFAGMELDIALFTNLRKGGIDKHHSAENFRKAQTRVVDYLSEDGVVVCNADDPSSWEWIENSNRPILTYGIREEANISARILESSLSETTFTIRIGNDTALIRTRLPGLHHVYNCLAAASAALLCGADIQHIATGIERVTALPGRMNLLNCGQEFAVAVDDSSSAYRLGTALNLLRRHTKGKLFCVFNAPMDCSNETAAQMGRVAERSCDVPVLTRPLSGQTWAIGDRMDYEPIHQILDGFDRPAKARIMPDRIAAIEWALSQAKPGDAVLIAGRGDQSIASMSNGKWELNDTEVCQSWLYGQSSANESIPLSAGESAIFRIDQYRRC